LNLQIEYLKLIESSLLLLQEEELILSSAEDADFFRQVIKKGFKKEKQNTNISGISYLKKIPNTPLKEKIETVPTIISAPEIPTLSEQKIEAKPEYSIKPDPPQIDRKIKENTLIKPISFTNFAELFSKIAPKHQIIKKIPDDSMAKKIANRWKTKNQTAAITLLTFSEPESHQNFLKDVTTALDVYFGGAKLVQAESIEKEKQWEVFLASDELKLIIVCDYTLWQLNGLMQFYKEIPAQAIRTLGKTPLFLLPDLSLYLKDASLKKSLWNALCQKIS